MPGTGPRPAIKCNEGVLSWQGMNTTPLNMREAVINPGNPWDFYCCPIGVTIPSVECSVATPFEATPVPEPVLEHGAVLFVGVVWILLLASAWRKFE